jgi:hypothetical protein
MLRIVVTEHNWCAYYSEKLSESESDFKQFASEEAACEYLLKLLRAKTLSG